MRIRSTVSFAFATALLLSVCANAAHTGKASKASSPSAPSDSVADSCHISNTYNSHVFAISWQPGFCQGHSSKPECQNLSKERFAKSNFTLHGLWPNKSSCGTNYDFCGSVKVDQTDFCQFPSFPLDSATLRGLDTTMPSVAYGTCLDRHEWWKHGTCQDSSATPYFNVAMDLLLQIDTSTFVTGYLRKNIGKTTSLAAFNTAFDQTFGQGSHFKIAVNCSGKILTEVQINLPKDLNAGIAELIAKGDKMRKGSCKDSFQILSVK